MEEEKICHFQTKSAKIFSHYSYLLMEFLPLYLSKEKDMTTKYLGYLEIFYYYMWIWYSFLLHFYLHLKCYPISLFPLETGYRTPTPASMRVFPHPPTSPPWHCPTLGHQAFTGPRASPPIDTWQGHPLLHMQWSHRSIPVFSWDGSLVPGTSGGGSGCLILCSSYESDILNKVLL